MDKKNFDFEGKLGILAGLGELPWIAARNAINAGEEIQIFCMCKLDVPIEYRHISEEITLTKFYTSVIKALKFHKISRIIVLGKITREILYKSKGFDFRLVMDFIKATSQNDYALFLIAEKILNRNKIKIIPQYTYLQNLNISEGRYGNRLNKREIRDVYFGIKHARVISSLNIGQTIVVAERAVLAVEAAEGSDVCIERGGSIYTKKGAVVCKLARKGHDLRNDMPTIGVRTLNVMNNSNCRVLVFDSKNTLIVNTKEFIKNAKKFNITLFSINSDVSDINYLKKLNSFFL